VPTLLVSRASFYVFSENAVSVEVTLPLYNSG
jgi:hypothetical protein